MDAKRLIINGLMGLCLSLIMWKLTESFLGWIVLFIPGALLVLVGWYVALRE